MSARMLAHIAHIHCVTVVFTKSTRQPPSLSPNTLPFTTFISASCHFAHALYAPGQVFWYQDKVAARCQYVLQPNSRMFPHTKSVREAARSRSENAGLDGVVVGLVGAEAFGIGRIRVAGGQALAIGQAFLL